MAVSSRLLKTSAIAIRLITFLDRVPLVITPMNVEHFLTQKSSCYWSVLLEG